jgi:hypothetical protein
VTPVPPTAPDAPTIGTATTGDAQASVAFTAPTNDGGAAITSYTVTSSPGGITATGTSSPITINGLTNGTAYTFTVTASNSVGTGAASAASNSVTPLAPPPSVTSITGKIFMDRNLGATQVASSSTDAASYGDLYQWGRGTDGHQIRTSNTTSTVSSSDTPGHGDFIIISGNWHSPPNDNLWQGANGVNNPCPSGFRLPTEPEWEAEIAKWDTPNAKGAFDSPLKLVLGGVRSGATGTVSADGAIGRYWSSTINGINSNFLNIGAGSAKIERINGYRANALAVRCIQD